MRCPACHQGLPHPDTLLSHTQGSLCGPPGFLVTHPKLTSMKHPCPTSLSLDASPPNRKLLVPLLFSCTVRKGWGMGQEALRKEARFPLQGAAGAIQGQCRLYSWLSFCLCQGFLEVGGLPSWALTPWQIGRQREAPLGPVLTAELGWRLRNQNCCVIATLQLLPG